MTTFVPGLWRLRIIPGLGNGLPWDTEPLPSLLSNAPFMTFFLQLGRHFSFMPVLK